MIVKWFAKRYVIGMLNDMLEQYKDNVSKVRDTLKTWIARLDKILFTARSLLEKLEDNKIDSEEIDQTIAEVEQVIAEW